MHWWISGRGMAAALSVSLLLHAAAYLASRRFDVAASFTPAPAAHYDARLSALATEPGILGKTADPAPRPPRPSGRPASARSRHAQPPQPASVTDTPAAARIDDRPPTDSVVPQPPSITDRVAAADTAPTAPLPEPPPAPVAAAPPVEMAPPPVREARPAFAERIAIDYRMTSAITDGVAHLRWTRQGDAYEIDSSIQATGFLISVFAGVLHQQSRGTLTAAGLQPQAFFMRRGEGEADTADFRHAEKALILKRGGNARTVPLAPAMQDMQSFLFQLAFEAPKLADADARLDVLVTNGRKVYRQQFRKVGEDTLSLAWGNVATLRLLSDAPNPEDAYEVWLAPAHAYLPVKLRFYIGRFPVEQTAMRLGSSGDGADEPAASRK